MKRDEAERRLELAEANLRQAAERLQGAEQRLMDIEDQRTQILGESELVRRSIADFESLAEKCRAELAALKLEELRGQLAKAVEARDQIIAEAADALGSAVALLGEVDGHRAAVKEAHKKLRSLDPAAGRAAPEEADVLHEPWQRMVSLVRTELDEELESDIVEAAARSDAPHAINSLPQHLRILATERRREIQRERMETQRELLSRKQRDA